MKHIVFLMKCPDHKGILADISSYFANKGFNILQCSQHTDTIDNRYFMRLTLDGMDLKTSRRALESDFEKFVTGRQLDWSVYYSDNKPKVCLMVSKTSHCLYDLLERHNEDELHCEIPLIISNHPTLEYIADQFKIPFFCLPVENGDKAEQEQKVVDLLKKHHIELVVLARYMQILSADFINAMPGRIINIHHAFLPAFEGGDPYTRAYERGVKMIGATAHYATAELDRGPIIEQDVERISHQCTPDELKRIGKDIERIVLSRAVKYHLENRIIIANNRTVIFK